MKINSQNLLRVRLKADVLSFIDYTSSFIIATHIFVQRYIIKVHL